MARTGNFGANPRPAPSLTNTLVAIAREFQRQRDQNLMDAWQKGGTFEGGKATDDVVLKYWKDRMEGVDKEDPLYDTYKNAHLQLDYSIHESKMTAAYALKKVGDAAMVSFYLKWAKKVPKNSEFYRVLQRDAGQYMRNASAASDAAARQAKEDHYQRLQTNTQRDKEAGGEYAIDMLRRVAQSGYADGGIPQAIADPGSGSDLTNFDPTDPETMLKLLRVIQVTADTTTDGRGGAVRPTGERIGNPDVIYYDDDKKPVTGQDIMDQFAKLVPGYVPGTPLDTAFVTELLDKQVDGLNERIKRAEASGHQTDAESLKKSKAYVATLNREVGAWPVEKAYQDLRAEFDSAVHRAGASPAALDKAWKTYQSGLYGLAKDPRIAANDAFRSRIVAEANGDTSSPTLNETFTGLQDGAFDGQSKDSATTQFNVKRNQAMIEAVNKSAALPDGTPGKMMWTYGDTDDQGNFTPRAGGADIGAATTEAIAAGGQAPHTVTIPDPAGGTPLTMTVTAIPIFITARDSKGQPLSRTDLNPIGYAYDVNGKTSYSLTMTDKDGTKQTFFTDDLGLRNPDGSPVQPKAVGDNGNHLELDMSAWAQQAEQVNPGTNGPLGGGFERKGVNTPARGANAGVTTPGSLVFDPQQVFSLQNGRYGTAGPDPNKDFRSLTMDVLNGTPDGEVVLQNLDKYPAVKQQITNDAYDYAGYRKDPTTGQYDLTTGNPAKLNQAMDEFDPWTQQSNRESLRATQINNLWNRDTTGSPLGGDTGVPAGWTPGNDQTFFDKLPADTLKDTAFAAMGDAFQRGTTKLQTSSLAPQDQFAIKTGDMLRVPSLPSVGAIIKTQEMGMAAAPTKVQQGPTQTGSQAPKGTNSQSGSTVPYRNPYGYHDQGQGGLGGA